MGARRPPGSLAEIEGCRALARQLLGWYDDPRVGAVFQYTFREDPAFPVGLLGPELSRVYPAYRLWQELAGRARRGRAAASAPAACGP
jgi:hypothetical protein